MTRGGFQEAKAIFLLKEIWWCVVAYPQVREIDMKQVIILVSLLLLLPAASLAQWGFERDSYTYAIVVKSSTYADSGWTEVVDTLALRHDATVFMYETNINEVHASVSGMAPDYIAFICKWQDATHTFAGTIWEYCRTLDSDVYGDAIWGIITGFEPGDALRIAQGPESFDVITVLGGTGSCDLTHYPQGISTLEATYSRYYTKALNDPNAVEHNDGPTDRTEWLVECLNADSIDIFITSGHGGHDYWQLHYPSSGLEGHFRSYGDSDCQAVGVPHTGPVVEINSTNPKIFFGLGNCNIGRIQNLNSIALGWFHTAGACFYTGMIIPEGSRAHQHGGTKAYFERQAHYTWSEAYFLANQALKFDILNSTPGANPNDLNGSVLYGDPAMHARVADIGVYDPLLYSEEVIIDSSSAVWEVTVRVTMNIEGTPGYTSKWGYRHPAVLLPVRVENITNITHDCHDVVVMDNFVLMYAWYQGETPLNAGDTREVTFNCGSVAIGEVHAPCRPAQLMQNCPNPFRVRTSIPVDLPEQMDVSLEVYDLSGRLVTTLADGMMTAGSHMIEWNGRDASNGLVPSGIYMYRLRTGSSVLHRTMLLIP